MELLRIFKKKELFKPFTVSPETAAKLLENTHEHSTFDHVTPEWYIGFSKKALALGLITREDVLAVIGLGVVTPKEERVRPIIDGTRERCPKCKSYIKKGISTECKRCGQVIVRR